MQATTASAARNLYGYQTGRKDKPIGNPYEL